MSKNYAPVDGGQPPAEQLTRPEDESPSLFAGVVDLSPAGVEVARSGEHRSGSSRQIPVKITTPIIGG